MRIAFIGLGAMGAPMANNLVKAGHELTLFDVVKANCDRVTGSHKIAATPAEAAMGAEIVITMLPSTPHVLECALGNNGIIHGIAKDAVYIDMSTISPVGTRKVQKAFTEKGVEMMDSPVAGGVPGATAGNLTLFIGCSDILFARVKPILEVMGKILLHMGEVGTGASAKLVHNMCNASIVAVFSEALVFGAKLGVEPDKLVDVLSMGSCANLLKTHVKGKGLDRKFQPLTFPVHYMMKDLGLVKDAARDLNLPMYYPSLSYELYAMLKAKGLGTGTYAEVIKLFEEYAGVEAKSKDAAN